MNININSGGIGAQVLNLDLSIPLTEDQSQIKPKKPKKSITFSYDLNEGTWLARGN